MNTTPTSRIDGLRAWAKSPCERATAELLIAFNNGHLVDGPWVRSGAAGCYWFDTETAAAENGYLSGGERRVLAVAMSLSSAEHPVDLVDVMTGIDASTFALVIQAMGQAFGLVSDPEPVGSAANDTITKEEA